MDDMDDAIPGSEFKRVRKALGWTHAQTQRFLRVKSVATISGWENSRGVRGLPFSAYKALEDELARRQDYVPWLEGTVPAGPLGAVDDNDIRGLFRYRRDPKVPHVAITIKGSSMTTAGYETGDTVVVREDKNWIPNTVVIARIEGEVTMKWLRRSAAGGYYLDGDTDGVIPYEDPESIEIVGRVVYPPPRSGGET
ncbi:MAG: S24 family peptidase [Mycobacterium sp.]